MDKRCEFLDRLAEWVSCASAPPLYHAALQRTRSFNNPSPLAGLVFQALGDFGEWRTEGRPWRLPANHLAIGCCHQGSASPEPTGPVELWAVAFNLEGIPEFDDLWENPVREKTPVSNPTRLTAAFRRTATLFLEAGRTDPLRIKAALLDLFAAARDEFRQGPGMAQLRPAAVEQALDWMADHFHEPDLALKDLAAAAGLSRHHFGRAFRETMGETAMQYLRGLRIRHSAGLLQGTALRINEIAFAVGFRDPLHFSRVFHALTGKSPRAFRHGDLQPE